MLCVWFAVSADTWKERLHTLEAIEFKVTRLAAGSYQNVYVHQQ